MSARPRRVAVFDFDGVIVRGDTFARLVQAQYRRQWWRVVAALPLLPLIVLLTPFRRGRRMLLRAAVRGAWIGVGEARYRQLAETFGRALARDARNVYRAGCTALNMHRHDGDLVVVATGCEEVLARAVLDELGFSDVALAASRLAPTPTGMRLALHNIGIEKAHQLTRLGIRPPWQIVYSDSALDLPIIAAARRAVLVNPDRATLARVSRRLGKRLDIVEWF